MKAIIPTAGVGSRLRPFTHTVPKVLLQVADKPILGHILDRLIAEDIRDVTFVVGYLGEMIEEYVRKEYGDIKSHFVEQKEARGLGHAIYITKDTLADCDEPVLIILGDTIVQADLSILHDSETDLIGVCEVDDPSRFGIVELDGEMITRMVEKPAKPKTNLAIVGLYYLNNIELLYQCLEENIDNDVKTKGEIQLTDALQLMLEKGTKMKSFKAQGWYDCGKPETLLATNKTLLEQKHMNNIEELQDRFPGTAFKAPVYVGPGAEVTNSIIGPYVTVAAGAKVDNSIAANSIINSGATVQNILLGESIIGNDARVERKAVRLNVGDRSEVVFD
ncbi:MAG: sugar phosphate nucleotidyltransferase [Candidatus Sumerlaeia bacterium]